MAEYPTDSVLKPGLWAHRKGGLYLVLGVSEDSTNGENEGAVYVVYYSLKYQRLRHRRLEEFLDGRFTPLRGEFPLAVLSSPR